MKLMNLKINAPETKVIVLDRRNVVTLQFVFECLKSRRAGDEFIYFGSIIIKNLKMN